MAKQRTSRPEVMIIEATEAHLPSLTTILARAFHPVNPVIAKALPNTPAVRTWWYRIFSDEMRSPSCHVLTSLDPTTPTTTTSILTLRLVHPTDPPAGFWAAYPITLDHDARIYAPMIAGMVEHEHALMSNQPHFLIELFGVDHACKGSGLGGKLLARACEIADEAGLAVFVQSNAFARDFYARYGFCEGRRTVVPGGEGEGDYVEHLMVRPAGREG